MTPLLVALLVAPVSCHLCADAGVMMTNPSSLQLIKAYLATYFLMAAACALMKIVLIE
jgi:hypothetical protein